MILIEKAPLFAGALVLLIIGWIAINIFVSLFKGTLEKRKIDQTLIPFLCSVISSLLKVGLAISLIGMIGVQTTSFIAILGAAGLAVGLALQGSLSNFAGGVLVLIFKPFRAGDFIEGGGHSGTVKEIQIFSTILTTPDNKTIILPNASLANGPIVNYSTQMERRVDFVFGISYSDDFEKAKSLLLNMIEGDARILSEPEPLVRVSALGASSIDITTRAWVKKEDYWAVYFDLTENVKKTFDREGISFPFPQRDVNLLLDESTVKMLKN